MKQYNHLILVSLLLVAFSLSSCEIIGDIFEAGVWAGLLLVVVVVGLIIWIISRFRRK